MIDGLEEVLPEGWLPGRGYSHGVITRSGSLLHLAAIAGIDPVTGEVDPNHDLMQQWERLLENLQTLVHAAGASMRDVAMLRIYVPDMLSYRRHARKVAALHGRYFEGYAPPATMLGVAALAADDVFVEMDAVVQLPNR